MTLTRNMSNKKTSLRPKKQVMIPKKKKQPAMPSKTIPSTTTKKQAVGKATTSHAPSFSSGRVIGTEAQLIPNKFDAVFGRGRKKTHVRDGSLYRSLVEKHWHKYSQLDTNKFDLRRGYVRKEIVNVLLSRKGRFIYRNGATLVLLDPNVSKDLKLIMKKIQRALFNERKRQESFGSSPPKSSSNEIGPSDEEELEEIWQEAVHDQEEAVESEPDLIAAGDIDLKCDTLDSSEDGTLDTSEDGTLDSSEFDADTEVATLVDETEATLESDIEEEDTLMADVDAEAPTPKKTNKSSDVTPAPKIIMDTMPPDGVRRAERRGSLESLAALASELLVLDTDIAPPTPPPSPPTLALALAPVPAPVNLDAVVPLKKRKPRCNAYQAVDNVAAQWNVGQQLRSPFPLNIGQQLSSAHQLNERLLGLRWQTRGLFQPYFNPEPLWMKTRNNGPW